MGQLSDWMGDYTDSDTSSSPAAYSGGVSSDAPPLAASPSGMIGGRRRKGKGGKSLTKKQTRKARCILKKIKKMHKQYSRITSKKVPV